MYVLLFDVFKHVLLRKTDVLKTYGKVSFSERKLKECTRFEKERGARYIRENTYFVIMSFRLQSRVSDFF